MSKPDLYSVPGSGYAFNAATYAVEKGYSIRKARRILKQQIKKGLLLFYPKERNKK